MWQFDIYASNIYVDTSTKESLVDILPLPDGATGTSHPLEKELSVDKALYVFLVGHA